MEKNKKGKARIVFLVLLVTLFCVSFSASAWIIINSNKLVFVEDMEKYEAITGGLEENEDKEQKIIDLTEQLERYKNMYESLSEENNSLVRANQNLTSTVSKLESQVKKQTSSSVKADKDEEDKEEEGKKDEEDGGESDIPDKKTTSTDKTISTDKKINSTDKTTSTDKKTTVNSQKTTTGTKTNTAADKKSTSKADDGE